MAADNLNDSVFAEIFRRLRIVENVSQLGNQSVTDGQTEFIGLLSLLVSGSGQVTGLWIIDGGLEGEGHLGWTGIAAFDGPVSITETLDVLASTKLQGIVELLSDLVVSGGGKILVGSSMKLVPSVDGGSVEFADGSRLSSSGGTTGIRAGGSRAEISATFAQLSIAGRAFTINSGGYQMTSLPTAPVSGYPGGFINAVVADAAGNLRRLVSG